MAYLLGVLYPWLVHNWYLCLRYTKLLILDFWCSLLSSYFAYDDPLHSLLFFQYFYIVHLEKFRNVMFGRLQVDLPNHRRLSSGSVHFSKYTSACLLRYPEPYADQTADHCTMCRTFDCLYIRGVSPKTLAGNPPEY